MDRERGVACRRVRAVDLDANAAALRKSVRANRAGVGNINVVVVRAHISADRRRQYIRRRIGTRQIDQRHADGHAADFGIGVRCDAAGVRDIVLALCGVDDLILLVSVAQIAAAAEDKGDAAPSAERCPGDMEQNGPIDNQPRQRLVRSEIRR